MKTWKIALIVIVVLAIAGGGFALYKQAGSGTAGSGTLGLAPGEELVKVRRGTLDMTVEASGNLIMPHRARLSFSSSGTVKVLNVEVGDSVKEGQLLAQLDATSLERAVTEAGSRLSIARTNLDKLVNPPNLAADIREAEADVESAKAALAYVEAIYVAEGSYPEGLQKKSQVESAEATLVKAEERLADLLDGPDERDVQLSENEVTVAELALEEAKRMLEEASLIAPFDSAVAEVNAKSGDWIMAAMAYETIILLVDTTQLEVEALVDEIDIAQIQLGQEVIITLDALPDIELQGKVIAVSPSGKLEAGVTTFPVKISVASDHPGLKDGMTAVVDLIVERKEDALLVPNRAVTLREGESVVRIIGDGQPQERVVQTGLSNEQWMEVTGGLAEGEQVILPAPVQRRGLIPGF
jgi:HlyD family secretion protein